MCFTVNSWSLSHWSHKGGWGLFSILNECVKRIWPIRRRLIITSSFLFVHPEWYFSSIWGMMACSLLSTSLSHRSCHKDEINGWIFIKTSVHGISKFSGCAFDKASFAARSASSFPLISLWLGIQQNVIYLLPDNILWHVCKTLFTRGFLLSWLLQWWKSIYKNNAKYQLQILNFHYHVFLFILFQIKKKHLNAGPLPMKTSISFSVESG